MNVGCYIVCYLVSHQIFDLRLAQGENTVKFVLLEWRQQMQRGYKIQMFVIGKSKSRRCFEGVKLLPCRNRNQNKSWMDSVLFEELMEEMDTKFTKEKKKSSF